MRICRNILKPYITRFMLRGFNIRIGDMIHIHLQFNHQKTCAKKNNESGIFKAPSFLPSLLPSNTNVVVYRKQCHLQDQSIGMDMQDLHITNLADLASHGLFFVRHSEKGEVKSSWTSGSTSQVCFLVSAKSMTYCNLAELS